MSRWSDCCCQLGPVRGGETPAVRRSPSWPARAGSSDSLIDLLSRAGEREFSLIPDWPLPEPLALAALRHVAGTYGDATARQRLDLERLRRIDQIVDVLAKLWPPRLRERPPSLGWSLTRNVNSLEWAIRNGNNEMLASIVADLETKRQDCLSSPDGAFGEVKISVQDHSARRR